MTSAQPALRADTTSVIARDVKAGRCILFLGAGVHYPPPRVEPPARQYEYPEEERPPLGGDLSETLAGECGFGDHFPDESPRNLARVSRCYEYVNDRRSLVNTIVDAVHGRTRPSPVLRALAEMQFPLVATTNYDQLFESALQAHGKRPNVSVYEPEPQTTAEMPPDPTAEAPLVIKLHGDVTRRDSLVITDEDYIKFIMRMGDKEPDNPIPETFRYYFKRWSTLFVGYSLKDYNLRLLFQTLRWKMDRSHTPRTYSVDPYPDPLVLDVLQNQQKYVTFVAEDAWSFVPRLYREVMGKEMPA